MMKEIKWILLFSIFVFSACEMNLLENEKEGNSYLPILRLSEESLQYLEVYKEAEKITFIKMGPIKTSILDERFFSLKNRVTNTESEKWIFYKDKEVERKMETYTSGKNNHTLIGRFEEMFLSYYDRRNNSLEISLEMSNTIQYCESDWGRISEFFKVRYGDPRKETYLRYLTQNYRVNNRTEREATIVLDSLVLTGKTFRNVMKLAEVKESANYEFYATLDEGIIRIDDLDKNVIWILDKME